jgi:type IV pilus assembly protein PilY1
MTITSKSLRQATASCFGTALLLGSVTTDAAPGTLSDTPMFLTNPVEPNVLFIVDDSGSMDWGTMTSESSGVMNLGCAYYYVQPAADNDYFWMVPTEASLVAQGVAAPYGGVWRGWSSDYNKVYYDSSTTYTPWPGENAAGNLYGNVNAAAAPLNPYVSGGPTVDLTSTTSYSTDYCGGGLGSFTVNNFFPARYQQWKDSDVDGVVDADDVHALVEIRPATPIYTGSANRRDCAAAPTCTYAEEIQNFANWFSYFRKREYVAKAAFGQVIAGANNARMGMVTLHNNAGVNTSIDSMNVDPRSGAKENLLDSLFELQASGGTPLRTSLDNGGRYLGCESNSFFGTCPALPVATGGECQQNFSVLMTDGYYNGGFGGVANADGDNNTIWDSGTAGPYGDNRTNSLADIAMEYYENDLRPGVDNNLIPPPGAVDENTAQHMVTYTVAFGVEGNITAMPPNNVDPFAWPAPITDPARIDDLRHSAWNSRGEFHNAKDPTQLISSLRGALRSIQSRIGSSASVAFNTGSLSTNSEIYLALFNSEQWDGDLIAYSLDAGTGAISSTAKWSAGDELRDRNLGTSNRTILTYDGTDGTALKWDELTTLQQNDFRTNAAGSLDDEATGLARLAYIRGDRGCEFSSLEACYYDDGTDVFNTKSLRERNGRLGDIVHSGPVFVGSPESNWPDVAPYPSSAGSTYTEYRDAQAHRPGVVYVGGNDGMLHGFRQTNGEEILGYIPNALFSDAVADGLHYYTDPAYSHRYAVDLRASVADAYVKSTATGSRSWKTVLTGGMRGGGRGLFMLDVTDPNQFGETGARPANTVMWEFTSADDADLGHTFSRPAIVPLEGSSNSIRWAVVVGNGYNDLGSGEAKLFILFLEEGLDGTWTAGSDYVEITTGVGTVSNRNGLSTPAVVDTDGDGIADRAYAGDLDGNMWAFDLSGSNTGNWDVAYKQGTTVKPLFVAPANQQITSTPVVVRNSQIPTAANNSPNTLVFFGTGQYLTTSDITNTDTQTMYGVWDSGDRELNRGDLIQQSISLGSNPDGIIGRTLSDNTVDYQYDSGWYIDLPDAGERVVTDPVIRGDLLFFNTMRPDTNPCESGGRGWLMVATWLSGARPSEISFDLNDDALMTSDDTINGEAAAGVEIVGIPTSPVNLANKRYTSTTQTTGGSTIEVTDILRVGGPKTGRLSWEELTQ